MEPLFYDRAEAGRKLADTLTEYASQPDMVLALPRGGVPVAFEVARMLHVPLDVLIVRKLGVPGHEELAMGAIASGGARVLNERVVNELSIPEEAISRVAARELEEIERREQLYRGDRKTPQFRDQKIVLVDDGLATGSTMRAAIQAVRQQQPAKIVVAVPVGACDTCAEFQQEADHVLCLHAPQQFYAVGAWYENFSQTTDQEVCDLLAKAWKEEAVAKEMRQ